MKKVHLTFVLLLVLCVSLAQAQVSVETTSGLTTGVTGGLQITLDGNWLNTGTLDAGSGTILLNGNGTQTITNTSGAFNHLTINKSGGDAQAAGNFAVDGTFTLTSGDVDLNGKVITLGTNALLAETPGNTVKGSSGDIETTRNLNAPSSNNVGGLGFEITSSSNLGSTVIKRGHAAQSGNGNQSILRYFDVSPANNSGLNASVIYHYDDSELNGQTEANLALYKSEDDGSTWSAQGGTANGTANSVMKSAVVSLSRWTAADQSLEVVPASGVTVELRDSNGGLIANSGATIQYQPNSSGSYIDFGDGVLDASGSDNQDIGDGTHRFRITYLGATQTVQQNVTNNPVVVFQTTLAVVELRNSGGNLIQNSGATIEWQPGSAGAYVNFGDGTLDADGTEKMEVLPLTHRFRLTYQAVAQTIQQNVASNSVVTFQTTLAVVELRNSGGSLIQNSGATIEWQPGSAGSYVNFGDGALDADGTEKMEVLPLTHRFQLSYQAVAQTIQQNVDSDSVVTFQTTLAVVELRNSGGNLIQNSGATIQWQPGSAGAYVNFGDGTLDADGTEKMEVLPLTHRFRLTYEAVAQTIQQNVASDSVVTFQTTLAVVELRDVSSGNLIQNSGATILWQPGSAGSYVSFGDGNLDADGTEKVEVLPLTHRFRLTYLGDAQTKQQNVSADSVVVFQGEAIEGLLASAGVDKEFCAGSSATIGGSPTASNGTEPYTYSWSPAAGLDDATIANPTASPSSTTTYTVTVTDANNQTATDEVVVTVNALPMVSISGDDPVVPGTTHSYSATTNAATPGYDWSVSGGTINGSNTGSSVSVTAGGIGTMVVSLEVTDGATTCGNSASKNVTVDDQTPPSQNFVFVANGLIEIDQNKKSSGDVQSNYGSVQFHRGAPGKHTGNLFAGQNIVIDKWNTIIGDAQAGNEILLARGASITGGESEHTPITVIALPTPSFSAGGPDKTVRRSGSLTLSPGSYGEVSVGTRGKLYLSAGNYFMNSLDLGASARIYLDVSAGPVNVNVVSELEFGQQVKVEIAGGGTELVTFTTLQDARLAIGQKSVIRGTLIAPDTEVHFDKESDFEGAVYADKITLDAKVAFQPHSTSASIARLSELEESEDVISEQLPVINDYELAQNYPNPFNPTTVISFQLPANSEASLVIYNISGQLVKQVANGKFASGRHSIVWDATDDNGARVASGIYFYKLVAQKQNSEVAFTETKRMMFVK